MKKGIFLLKETDLDVDSKWEKMVTSSYIHMEKMLKLLSGCQIKQG